MSGNALLWPDGVWRAKCGVRGAECGIRFEIRKTQQGELAVHTIGRSLLAIGRSALAGAGERRECLVLVPLVRRL